MKLTEPRLILGVFAVTVFLGAALLFQLEPLVGKSLLPSYGGTPAVWNTCVLFFQLVLLLGYVYAHILQRYLPVPGQLIVQGALVMAALLTLPIRFNAAGLTADSSRPLAALLVDLAGSIGLVFFVVSTTAPLLQSWYAAARPRMSPYSLYVASNFGSLVSLLAYPTVVEFWLPLSSQSWLLTWSFVGLAALLLVCGLAAWRGVSTEPAVGPRMVSVHEPPPTNQMRRNWLLWSMCPSSMMLGVTTYLSAEIAPMPAIWILPLSLYLLSFIIAFGEPPRWVVPVSAVLYAILAICAAFTAHLSWMSPLVGLLLHNGLLFCGALALHCQLAATRPGVKHLTEFYLWIACGGLCGSIFNTLVAPLLFNWLAEYALAIACGVCLMPWLNFEPRPRRMAGMVIRTAMATMVLLGLSWNVYFSESSRSVIHRERTFFGEFHIVRGKQGVMHRLVHGGTEHGMQLTSRDLRERRPPLTYYFFTGPIGQLILANRGTPLTQSVGVVGLGVGSLAAYAERGEDYTFYEIDPAIDRVAQNNRYFTYLADSRERGATTRVVLGDARLKLREAPDKTYGLLVLDAFTSDAIPVHLLTKEAIVEYFAKLQPTGVLACHISNLYVDLEPVLANIATNLGYVAYIQEDHRLSIEERRRGKNPSTWLVITRSDEALDPVLRSGPWRPCRPRPTLGVWTDDQSNLLSAVRWGIPTK